MFSDYVRMKSRLIEIQASLEGTRFLLEKALANQTGVNRDMLADQVDALEKRRILEHIGRASNEDEDELGELQKSLQELQELVYLQMMATTRFVAEFDNVPYIQTLGELKAVLTDFLYDR